MNYHLLKDGQNRGVFSVDELRRQQAAGDLDGTELVWREGMAGWQPLHVALGQSATPPALPRKQSGTPAGVKALIIVAAVGTIVFVGTLGTIFVVNIKKGYKEARQRALEKKTEISLKDAEGISDKIALTFPTNSMTYRDGMKRGREFRVRQYLDGYKERGHRDTACDADCVKLIENWIAQNFDGDFDTNAPAVDVLSDRIAANETCDDPLVLTVAGVNAVELRENIRRLERAFEGFQTSNHRAYPKLYAAVMLAEKVHDQHGRVPPLDSAALKYFEEAFSDGSFLPEDQAELGEIFHNSWGQSFFGRQSAEVIRIVKSAGTDFRWLALVLEGEHKVNAAWKARGGGYADTVSQKRWDEFYEHLRQAREAFTEAWEMRPDLPLAPARMVYVAMGDADEREMYLWLNRTLAAQVDYHQAWSSMRWGLRPRWHGDFDSMLALGISAVNSGRFDTDVPRKLMDVISDLEAELKVKRGEHIYGSPDIWPHLQRMYEGYINEPKQAEWRAGWQSAYAVVAYFAGKYEIARTQMEALNWKPRPSNLQGWGKDLSSMHLEIAARTSRHSQAIARAEELRGKGKSSAALDSFRKIEVDPEDTRTAEFVTRRIQALEVEKQLEDGNWVSFLPTKQNDPNFNFVRGQFNVRDENALEVTSGNTGHFLYSLVPVGTNFEARGVFEVIQSSSKDFQAGLVMGIPDVNSSSWYAFRMKRNEVDGEIATFADGWTRHQVYHPAQLTKTNTFAFRFQDGKATATVNDKVVLMEVPPPRTNNVPNSEFLFGIGAFNDMNETVIRYRDVQVKRLK